MKKIVWNEYVFCLCTVQNNHVRLCCTVRTEPERNWVYNCNKLWLSNTYIFPPDSVNLWFFKPRFLQSYRIHSLKYLRSTELGCKNIEIRKSKFVAIKWVWNKVMKKHIVIIFQIQNFQVQFLNKLGCKYKGIRKSDFVAKT